MQLVRDGKIKTQEKQSLYPRQTWMRVIIVLGLTILYIATFQLIVGKIGSVGASLIAIPVVATGLYFGMAAGLVASFFSVVLNTFLLIGFEGGNWFTSIINYWPGILFVFAAGYTSSRLRVILAERERMLNSLRSRE